MAISLSNIKKTKHATPPRFLIHGGAKLGKALAIDTPIPTPTGFKLMGDLKTGDSVFDADGKQCTVIAATETMLNRPCYRVVFSNGHSVIADESHLWRTRLLNSSTGKPAIRTTLEILETLTTFQNNRDTPNHQVVWHNGVQINNSELPIDPYILGVWLGDGTSSCGVLTIAVRDKDIIDKIQEKGQKISILQEKNNCFRCSMSDRGENKGVFFGKLKEMNLIDNKHIPNIYLFASYEQRLELLRGLMDTDGYVDKDQKAAHEFTSCSKKLADDFEILLSSLGIIARRYSGRATINGVDCGEKHRFSFFPSELVVTTAFKKERALNRTSRRKTHGMHIKAIEKVDSVPVRCIQVSSKDGMFLAGNGFIPTHNSTFSANAPNPIFIRTEDGLNGIDTNAFDLAKSYMEVKEALIALQSQPHDFKTVVIDSADWLEALIHQHICKTNGTGSMRTAEGGYGNAYTVAANIFKEVLDYLDDLNKRLGMIVIVICHSTVSELRDPEHETYDIAGLKLHKAASAKLCEWADVIGYAKRPIVVTKNNDGDYKAIDKGQNVMNELILGSSATSVSGNRYSLPQKIPLSWQAFEQAFTAQAQMQQPAVPTQNATQSAAQTSSN